MEKLSMETSVLNMHYIIHKPWPSSSETNKPTSFRTSQKTPVRN